MAAQAGWYVDPRDARQYRYWDGDRWSQSTQPIPELADAASANGGANGSLSAGGAKDPVGADAFDQAPAAPTDSEDDVLADFMWTSGFGETPDDPTANAGPTMFTPGSEATATPAPAAPVAAAPVPPTPVAPVPPVAAAPVPPAPAAPAPQAVAPPAPEAVTPPAPTLPTAPTAPAPDAAKPLFRPPPAAAAPGFDAPGAMPSAPSSTPDGGSPLFSPPGATGGAQFDPTPAATPQAPAAARAAGSLFAPIDPSLQPIFGAGDHPDASAKGAASGKKGRKVRGKAAPAVASDKVPLPPSSLSAAEPFRLPEHDAVVPQPDLTIEDPPDVVGAVKVKADRKADRTAKAAKKPKATPAPKAQKGNAEAKSKLPILLGALGVVVLGAAAFLLLSGGDDEGDTAANVAGTTVEKTATTVAPAETTAAPVETTAAPATTAAAPASTALPPVTTADPTAVAGFQAAFDTEATRACEVIKADPGILTEDVIKYDPAWAAIPKTYQDLQQSVNDCTFQARDEALKRVAALDAAKNGG